MKINPRDINKLAARHNMSLHRFSGAIKVPYARLYDWCNGATMRPRPDLWADFMRRAKEFEAKKKGNP